MPSIELGTAQTTPRVLPSALGTFGTLRGWRGSREGHRAGEGLSTRELGLFSLEKTKMRTRLWVGLDDLRDLFQPLQFNDSTVGDQVGLGSKKSGLVGGKVT